MYSAEKFRGPDRSKANICVYNTNQSVTPPTASELREKVRRTFETRDVYHTIQENNAMSYTAAITHPGGNKWNLANTYGV